MVEEVIDLAVQEKAAIAVGDSFQAAGAHIMERYVADRIRTMLQEPVIGDLIARKSRRRSSRAGSMPLTSGLRSIPEQREAVRIAVQQRCGIIRGGAGVGKTTDLRAIARA